MQFTFNGPRMGAAVVGLANQVVMDGIGGAIGRFYSIAAAKQEVGGYLLGARHLLK